MNWKSKTLAALLIIVTPLYGKAQNSDSNLEIKKNTIRISPIKLVDYGPGLGVSLEYERFFPERNIGISLPFVYLFKSQSNSTMNNNDQRETYYYFNPGLKFYPSGIRKVTYAIGPSLIIGYGSGTSSTTIWNSNTNTPFTRLENFTNTRLCLLVNNYIDFAVARNFVFGIELGFGVRYINKYIYDDNRVNNFGFGFSGNFSVSFGYKF